MKSWKGFLLSLLLGMAVVSTAHANPIVIWQKATSDKPEDSSDQEVLRNGLIKEGIATNVDFSINTERLAGAAYIVSNSKGCFNGLSELNSPEFVDAFKAEWVAAFRKSYKFEVPQVSWTDFKKAGRLDPKNPGFIICDQEQNQRLIEVVNERKQIAVLTKLQTPASQPMSEADRARNDALEARIKDHQAKIDDTIADIGNHEKLILDLRTDVTTLQTGLSEVVGRVGKLEERVGPIETTAGTNTQAIATINGTLISVGADTAAAKADAEEAKRKVESTAAEIPSIWERIKQLDLWTVVAAVLAFLTLVFAIFGIWPFGRKKDDGVMDLINQADKS